MVVFSTIYSFSQERVVHGIVTALDSISVINAQVRVKSSKQTVLTDTLGRFSVTCSAKDVLKVSASGFFPQRVKLEEKIRFAAINLRLKPGEKNFEYAVGYGHISEKDRTIAVARLNTQNMDSHQYNNIYDMIRGRFAGVYVSGNEIIIRGPNSLMGSSSALIVIDGVITDSSNLSTVNPSQVKSIDIIKDGGAAIYGSRGANGVVIIETKKGSE